MNIGILDHMGYGNLGDAATQDVVIANIRKRLPDARLVGFSFVPRDTEKRHGIPCFPIQWWCPTSEKSGDQVATGVILKSGLKAKLKRKLKRNAYFYNWARPILNLARELVFLVRSYKRLRQLDLLIISGGGQIDEIWEGPWLQPYTLFKFCLLAKLARKKLYFLNVGAGPLKHSLSRLFAKWAVRFADYRSFRDHDSEARIQSLGVKAETHVYPDLAYGLEPSDAWKNGCRAKSMPVVGLNPFRFCHPLLQPRKDEALYEEYLKKLTEFSVWLLARGYKLRLFTTDHMNDVPAIQDLQTRLRSTLSSPELACRVSGGASESVEDVLREMSNFDVVITSKYHGIIFAHVLRKPVISLSYHTKMDAAMQAVGQDYYCANIENFEVNWLTKAFLSLVHDGKNIKSRSAAAVEANVAMLSQQFDSLFL